MTADTHPAPFTIERLVADDLAGGDLQTVRAHVEGCERCRGEVARLRADLDSFTREVPFTAFAARHRARLERSTSRRRSWLFAFPLGLGLAAATAAVLFVAVPHQVDDGYVGIKGTGVSLSFTVRDGASLRAGVPGEVVTSGTVLQLSYDAGRHTHLALLGVDGAGVVTAYYPDGGDRLAPLPAGSAGAFPFSLTLDGTAGVERFVAVFADEAAPLAPVRAAVEAMRATGGLTLPAGMVASTVWVKH
jgi:hypothetical protein